MPTPSRIGSVSTVNISAASGSTSVTVPAGATAVVAFWSGYASGIQLSSLTLDSTSFTLNENEANTGDLTAFGVGTLSNPSTGSQTAAWSWSGGPPSDGGQLFLTYLQDTHSTPVRDSGTDAQDGGTPSSGVTVDSATTDLVLGMSSVYNGDGATPKADEAGQTVYVDEAVQDVFTTSLAEVDSPGASTTTFAVGTVSPGTLPYYAVAAISLVESAASGITGTGTPESQDAEVSGSGTVTGAPGLVTGSGAAQSELSEVSGTGERIIIDIGSPVQIQSQNASLTGSGSLIPGSGEFTGAGDIAAQSAIVVGAGLVKSIIEGTGVIESQDADVTGTGDGITLITGSGAVQSESSAVSGSGAGLSVIFGTGAIAAQAAIVSGSGSKVSIISGSGELVSGPARVRSGNQYQGNGMNFIDEAGFIGWIQ